MAGVSIAFNIRRQCGTAARYTVAVDRLGLS